MVKDIVVIVCKWYRYFSRKFDEIMAIERTIEIYMKSRTSN